MFEQFVIVENSLKRLGDDISVDLRIPYYRGLGLSMVAIPELRIDGIPADLSEALFAVHHNEYRLLDLPKVVDDRWGFTEPARLTLPGLDLTEGQHEIDVVVDLRISYMPVPTPTRARKVLELHP